VYAVYDSLGFAAAENLLDVYDNGIAVGLLRAVTAVPAHALFGVIMGYYLSLAKFIIHRRRFYLILSWGVPVV